MPTEVLLRWNVHCLAQTLPSSGFPSVLKALHVVVFLFISLEVSRQSQNYVVMWCFLTFGVY